MPDGQKKLYFLPNILTALNMGCGFIAIMLALKFEFYEACMFITLAAVFDSVDGRIARLTHTESSFGEQFDSLCDLISFGMAPALLFYQRFFIEAGRPGMVLTFLFVLCGALRLARFNANIDKVKSDYFQGLPIPIGAMGLVSYILFSLKMSMLNEVKPIAMIYIFFYSAIMISNIPFPSFKNSEWVKNHKKQVLLIVILIIASMLLYEQLMIGVWLSLYIILSFTYYFTHKDKYKGIFEFEEEKNGQT